LEAARQAGARSIIAGIGGSATNDGGTGMASALATVPGHAGRDTAARRFGAFATDRIDATGLECGLGPVKVMVALRRDQPADRPARCELRVWTSEGRGPLTVGSWTRRLDTWRDVIERDFKQTRAGYPRSRRGGEALERV